MKCMVVYSSRTGNTKKIAEAVLKAMPDGTDIYPVEKAPDPKDYDFIAVGYWVDKATADERSREYMSRITRKKVATFGTLGAYPDSDHAKESRENVKNILCDRNEILGDFLCQGKIDPKLTEMMKKMGANHPHGMTEERLKRHMDASSHPDELDLRNAQRAFEIIVEKNM